MDPTFKVSISPAAINSYIFDLPIPVSRQASFTLTVSGARPSEIGMKGDDALIRRQVAGLESID